jgi:predicted RNase H-like nuclease (RuvC/YqgF family)
MLLVNHRCRKFLSPFTLPTSPQSQHPLLTLFTIPEQHRHKSHNTTPSGANQRSIAMSSSEHIKALGECVETLEKKVNDLEGKKKYWESRVTKARRLKREKEQWQEREDKCTNLETENEKLKMENIVTNGAISLYLLSRYGERRGGD